MLTDTITRTRTNTRAVAYTIPTALASLASRTPLSAADLMRLATGAGTSLSQDGIDLALALAHELDGQHAGGTCDACDLRAVNEYALKMLLEAQR